MPVDMREWLPEDDLVWLVLDAVAEMDLRSSVATVAPVVMGGRHGPSMMVARLLRTRRGERSPRGIERECVEDIAYRVIAANGRPDRTTIARFVQRHEATLTGVFGSVLAVCARQGWSRWGDRCRWHEGARERNRDDA